MFLWKRFWYGWVKGWTVLYAKVVANNGEVYGLFNAYPKWKLSREQEHAVVAEWNREIKRIQQIGARNG